MTPGFPFSAIVGSAPLLEALLVNAVSPEVGGVLIRGERGTAKSTAVRALAPLLPPVLAAREQAFSFAPGDLGVDGPIAGDAPCELRPAPLVELPVGATVDRLVGALDLGRALAGERAFEAGLLARAHRGVLYVDEVNLLPDHLVDVLLDAAAMGVCHVERDAVSVRHEARFLLVGTMNAEEGELRPQLLDRFGLGVEARAAVEPEVRAEIVRRRLAYEADPEAFAAAYADADAEVAGRIADARSRLRDIRLGERELGRIVRACAELGVDGVRGDIVTARTARVLAALDGASDVDGEHVRRAAHLALAHRRRQDPLDGSPPDPADVDRAFDDDDPPPPTPRGGDERSPAENGATPHEAPDLAAPAPRDRLDAAERSAPIALPRLPRNSSGAPIDSRPGDDDLAIVATLLERLASGDPVARRSNVRAGQQGALLCLVVDASGSMAARRRMARVKGALDGLLRDAYARRDRVAIVAFRDACAQVVHAPGEPLAHAAAAIAELRTGGRTPLDRGLDAATELIHREHSRDPGRRAIAVVLTDGRAPAAGAAAARLGRTADAVHVVDTEDGAVRLGLARSLAVAAGGSVIPLPGRAA